MQTKILLIDDDFITTIINKKIIQRELDDIDTYDFCSASLALIFLKKFRKCSNVFFVIFLDINMPEINGWEFMEIIEKDFSHLNIRIHLLTSSIDQDDQKRAQEYRFVQSYIVKPLNRSKLARELELGYIMRSG